MEIPFVDLAPIHEPLRAEIDAAIARVVDSGAFVLGPDVGAFETEFAAYCEAAHCVGVASGTAALHLAYQALEIGPGDEVIVPANAFIAAVLPLLHLGATPVLVDCLADTATIDPVAAADAVTGRTRAIVAVHLYGQPADMDELAAVAGRHGLHLVEDAAQAHGARYRGRRVGSLGDVGCFSFYPGKNLGCFGDGGAITTSEPDIAERVRVLRDLGQRRKHHHEVVGHNERLDTIQAAVLRVKLRALDDWNAARRRAAEQYTQELAGLPAVRAPRVAPGREHVWHLYVVRCEDRDAVRDRLQQAGVGVGLHYPIALSDQAALRGRLGGRKDFPVTADWAGHLLSLPMYAGLAAPQIAGVREALAGAIGG